MTPPAELDLVYVLLVIWNSVCALLVFFSIFSPWVSTWPRYIRMIYASVSVILIAEALMYGLKLETLTNPWWAIKDICLGAACILIVRHIYTETQKIVRAKHGFNSEQSV